MAELLMFPYSLFMRRVNQMYKAIKENKIIAVNDSGKFPCLIFDEVVEDSEHEVTDYVMVGSEFVLSDDERAIELRKQEHIAELRQFLADTDYIANKLIEALDDAELQDLKEKYADVLAKRRQARLEISKEK